MKNIALNLAGVVFAVIGFIHIIRVLSKTEVIVDNHVVSQGVSVAGAIVSLLLAWWMFYAAKKGW